MNWSDAQNWLDIIDHLWIGVVAIMVSAVPAWFSAKNHKGIKSLQNQVANGHTSPMRLDLDKVIVKLGETGEKIDDICQTVHGLKTDLAKEEELRRADIRDLRGDFDRKFTDIVQRMIR